MKFYLGINIISDLLNSFTANPRNGKTTLAKMVAEETGMAFLSVSAAEIVTKCSGREKVEKMPKHV